MQPQFALTHLHMILAAFLVLVVPGSALLVHLPRAESHPVDALSRLADALGLSISLSALIGLWLFVAGIRLSGGAVAAFYGAALLLWAWGLLRRFQRSGVRISVQAVIYLLGACIFLLALVIWRFYQARDLALPAWVDSRSPHADCS